MVGVISRPSNYFVFATIVVIRHSIVDWINIEDISTCDIIFNWLRND